jgi:hypothetical protein
VVCLLAVAGCSSAIAPSPAAPATPPVSPSAPLAPMALGATPLFVSPDTNSHQGYASNGFEHFTIDTLRLDRRRDDAVWTVLRSNNTPFAGLPQYNHLGDGDYAPGTVYVAVVQWIDCSRFSSPAVFAFDAESLARLHVFSVPEAGAASALAVDATEGVAYIASYCDSRRIFKYTFPDWTYAGAIALSSDIPAIQGLDYAHGFLYASSDGLTKRLYSISSSSGDVQELLTFNVGSGSYEGIDVSSDGLRWLIDLGLGRRQIYYFSRQSVGAPLVSHHVGK